MVLQTSQRDVALSTLDGRIVCKLHDKEVCLSCMVDWTAQNQLASSIKDLKELPAPNKPNPELNNRVNKLKLEGNAAYKAKKYKEALALYDKAVELAWSRPLWEPLAFQYVREELAPILSNRSATQVYLDNHVSALVDAEAVTRLKRDWGKGWFRKGKALHGLGRYQEAMEAYRTGLIYDSKSDDLLEALKESEKVLY
ncbi:TPR-like protein [Backusella circina FSU 941]|nr:TPR-like protein [Backusella circina FSU 941]